MAEVLITLGIIGIVCAITLPSLIQNYNERATVSKVKKAYSVVSNAFLMAISEHGPVTDWQITGNMSTDATHKQFANIMKKYMNVAVDCTTLKNSSDVKKYCLSNDKSAKVNEASILRLTDGTLVYFRIFWPECTGGSIGYIGYTPPLSETCGAISVHFNEANQKNGINSFAFFITKNAIVPYGTADSTLTFEKACNPKVEKPYPGFSPNNMYACTAWVLQNENLDYLHCPDSLSWNGAHSCKEAKQ